MNHIGLSLIWNQWYRNEPDIVTSDIGLSLISELLLSDSIIGTSDIGLKGAESDIISDIRLNFPLISNIRRILVYFPPRIL